MKLRNAAVVLAGLGCAAVMAQTAAPATAGGAQGVATAADLVGTWRLVSIVRRDPKTGVVSQPWGEHPRGYISYLANGRMVVIFSKEKQTVLREDATTEQLAALYGETVAYAGRYEVAGREVRHFPDVSTHPTYLGATLTRPFVIDGRRVSLFSAATGQTLTWEKVD